jgi:[ribosomal protein S5]-alanine N-acetyltransferase
MDFVISTERLILRPPSMDDAERLFTLMSDNNLTRFLTWEPHSGIDNTQSVIQSLIEAQKNDRGYHWCVLHQSEIIGLVSLIDVRRKIRTWILNRAELSYWIGTQYQGKGFATEAAKAIVEFGFLNLGFHRIIVAHASKNVESEKICSKIGFSKYAYEHDAFAKENEWHDLVWYERINS